MDLAEGTCVTPVVRLVRLLGKGGMSQVWVADHLELGAQVAVKFLSREAMVDDPTMAERFKREAELAAKIQSPHVVQVFEHGVTEDATAFIVMELLGGETLAEHVDKQGTLGPADAALVLTQTAKALARAHRLGIVHRDIKPENLFLVESDAGLFVKVLDFGIAKQAQTEGVSPVTATGTMVGTPAFMSPEQVLSSKGVDYRSDLWSLAVVAYFVLTGRTPFSGQTLGALCVAIASGRYAPVCEVRPGLPMALEFWFSKALRINPEERFQSARELALAFVEACGGSSESEADKFSSIGGDGSAFRGPTWSNDELGFGDSLMPTLPSADMAAAPDALTRATRTPVSLPPRPPTTEPEAELPKSTLSTRVLVGLVVVLSLAIGAIGALLVMPPSETEGEGATDGSALTSRSPPAVAPRAAPRHALVDADAPVDGASAEGGLPQPSADAAAETASPGSTAASGPHETASPHPPTPSPSQTTSAAVPSGTTTSTTTLTKDRGF